MASETEKMAVAQNCSGYSPKNSGVMSSMGNLSESCSNCANFIKGKCDKNLFDSINDSLKFN